jgi:hypothetical protein
MKANVKPVKLTLGANYRLSYYMQDFSTIVKLIKATPTGYKFMNVKNFTCGKQKILYPSREPNHQKKGELWFWIPQSLCIEFVPDHEAKECYVYEPDYGSLYGIDEWGNYHWGHDESQVALFTKTDALNLILKIKRASGRNRDLQIKVKS